MTTTTKTGTCPKCERESMEYECDARGKRLRGRCAKKRCGFEWENSYLASAYSGEYVAAVVAKAGFKSFKEMVAHLSADGHSLQGIARKLGLSVQGFTAYHAKWIAENAEPLDLEDI